MKYTTFSDTLFSVNPLTLLWPSAVAPQAEAWRLLDLSGVTNSVRESKNFTLAGFVYINGSPIRTLKDRVPIGADYTLQVRFPNGRVKSKSFFLSRRMQSPRTPRSQQPTVLNYRG